MRFEGKSDRQTDARTGGWRKLISEIETQFILGNYSSRDYVPGALVLFIVFLAAGPAKAATAVVRIAHLGQISHFMI